MAKVLAHKPLFTEATFRAATLEEAQVKLEEVIAKVEAAVEGRSSNPPKQDHPELMREGKLGTVRKLKSKLLR